MEHNHTSDERHPIHSTFTESGYRSIQDRETQSRSSNGSANDSGYTELLSGSVPCPTCRGLGNVPKEQEGQLIALIPMKDKRLKPRRTYLWVGLAILLCLVAAGLLLFFMFPRDVMLESTKPYLDPIGPVKVNVTEQYVNFEIINYINVSNHNYFPIKVTGVEMTVQYDTMVIVPAVKNVSVMDVPIRSQKLYYVQANITLDKENQMGYMALSCKNPIRWAHEMVMQFQFTCNYSYLGHTEQATLSTFQFVSCYSKNQTSIKKDEKTKSYTIVKEAS